MFGIAPHRDSPTDAQQRILDCLGTFLDAHGYAPSIQEIAAAVDRRQSSVKEQLDRLERDGYVKRDPGRARSLELTAKGRYGRRHRRGAARATATMVQAHSLPIVGRLAAGSPVLADDNIDDYLVVGFGILDRGAVGAVSTVVGDSMEPALHDGDLVIVELGAEPQPGQFVAARVGDDESADEVVIKIYKRRGRKVVLESLNPAYSPLENGQAIIGVARRVIRALP